MLGIKWLGGIRGVPEGSLFNYLMNSSGRDQLVLGFTRTCLWEEAVPKPYKAVNRSDGKSETQVQTSSAELGRQRCLGSSIAFGGSYIWGIWLWARHFVLLISTAKWGYIMSIQTHSNRLIHQTRWILVVWCNPTHSIELLWTPGVRMC